MPDKGGNGKGANGRLWRNSEGSRAPTDRPLRPQGRRWTAQKNPIYCAVDEATADVEDAETVAGGGVIGGRASKMTVRVLIAVRPVGSVATYWCRWRPSTCR